ncbi:hypothetical protein [Streptomyces radicis]|uniref:Uncharacterized protein n=1 Tax=Streptomyces radicis TaxID=1750517 RepID=A0A3A9VWJ0_9ACTN|nr:hypothetical protein [Streptomyces radicis]RKN04882.1 hypothetical protein D7319_27175 [Streptomyces radicis]RKN25392.1 hypothetical protein D7318_09335 [Streptomyces radicis]
MRTRRNTAGNGGSRRLLGRAAVLIAAASAAVLPGAGTVLAQPGGDRPIHSVPSGDLPQPAPRTEVIYDSIPEELPPHVASLGYQATGTSEFGDEVGFGSEGNRKLKSIEVVLSSWACEAGRWNTTDCFSSPDVTFDHPITINVYEVDNSGPTPVPGTLLASQTDVATIPYRPSANPVKCTGVDAGRWYDATTGTCNDGIAHPVVFDFGGTLLLPDEIIWTVAFDTSSYGAEPIGTGTACFATAQGCPYDALNVGAQTFPGAPYAGIDIEADAAFLDPVSAASYCDAGAGGTGVLRWDAPCWADNGPLARITATEFEGRE